MSLNTLSELKDDINFYQTFYRFVLISGEIGALIGRGWSILAKVSYNIVEQLLWKNNAGGYISLDYEVGLNSYGTNIVGLVAN